ncbi:hypothetical protein Tsubulata_001710 [Turnera subulata]|uniref:DUF4283 domain-containing protein n=1 Tax=Turnera subulata TaxID=218843 RepID=A0A9Q0G1S7_9ROSI|nr:hypothetical protein Tsubulata_001710 [Turnera subulata]
MLIEKINSIQSEAGVFTANLASLRGEVKPSLARQQWVSPGADLKGAIKEGISFSQVVGNKNVADVSNQKSLEQVVQKPIPGKPNNLGKSAFVFKTTEECLEYLNTCAFEVLRDGFEVHDVSASMGALSKSCLRVKSLGGCYVLVSFKSRKDMVSCVDMENDSGYEYFDLFKPWEEGDHASHRLCWLNVIVTPPQAWCEEFFSNIAVHFGRFVKLYKGLSSCVDLDVARIQVLTTYREPIARSFTVSIKGKPFEISVVEAQLSAPVEFVPSFDACDFPSTQRVVTLLESAGRRPCTIKENRLSSNEREVRKVGVNASRLMTGVSQGVAAKPELKSIGVLGKTGGSGYVYSNGGQFAAIQAAYQGSEAVGDSSNVSESVEAHPSRTLRYLESRLGLGAAVEEAILFVGGC